MIAPSVDAVRRTALRLTLPLLCGLAAGCDDAKVVACFGDQDFCGKIITANVPPTADAGADQEVTGGADVTLDGAASTDPDGRIASFSWAQQSGTPVTLRDAGQATATFTAPDVETPDTLIFRLTVVDDHQAASADEVSVVVQPAPAMAAALGFAVLSRSVAPDPVLTPAPCSAAPRLQGAAWFAQAGLWLTAHVTALEPEADADEVTRFLDAARVLLGRADNESPATGLADAFWQHGLDALRSYASARDPALSEWAGSRLTTTKALFPDHLRRGEIALLTVHGEPSAVARDPTTATTTAAASVRSGCRSGLDPLRLSADTVFLLERVRETSRAHLPATAPDLQR